MKSLLILMALVLGNLSAYTNPAGKQIQHGADRRTRSPFPSEYGSGEAVASAF